MTKNLEEKIKEEIKNQKPKPKWYFLSEDALRDIVLFLLWVVLIVAAGFATNIFIDFQLNRLKVPGPGQFFGFLSFFPFEIFIFIAVLIVVIYYLFRNIGFLYRLSPWLIIILIFGSVFLGYFASEAVGANEAVINSTFGQRIYSRQGKLFIPEREDVVVGIIVSVSRDIVEIEDFEGKQWEVIISDKTDRREIDSFAIGERVWVLGQRLGDTIEAQAIRSMRNQPRGRQMRGRDIMQPPVEYQIYGTNLN